jgi:hypothetical protein
MPTCAEADSGLELGSISAGTNVNASGSAMAEHALSFKQLTQIPSPRVDLRGIKLMPAGHGTDAHATRTALCDNRNLHLRRPLTALAGTGEYLQALRAPAHRIITRD